MASLDWISELTDKLIKQDIDYCLVAVQRGKPENKLHLFYSIPDEESVACIGEGINEAIDLLENLEQEYKKEKKHGKKHK